MQIALDKTKDLVRGDIPISKLYVNEANPNVMSDEEFNLLFDNISRMGITDPILVRAADEDGKYRIIGVAHRYEVAVIMGFEEVPCTVVTDPNFSYDEEMFQLTRHNIIHGSMNPKKFVKLYQSLTDDYSDAVAAEMFGFAEQAEFKKLVKATKKALPKEYKSEFDKATRDIKSIDELADVLNSLFREHGDTLPYGYMIVDFGGKDSVWLRMTSKDRKVFDEVAEVCMLNKKTVPSVVMGLVRPIAAGDPLDLDRILEQTADVVVDEFTG